MASALVIGLIFLLSSTALAENSFQPLTVYTKLRTALHTDPVDYETIMRLASDLTYDQRLEINLLFKKLTGKGFEQYLNSKNQNDFRDLLALSMLPQLEVYARSLNYALKNDFNDRVKFLVSILSTVSNKEMEQIKKIYYQTFGESLENDIRSYSELFLVHYVYHGDFEKLMLSLASGKRDEGFTVNVTAARIEAENLFEQGQGKKWSTNDAAFILLFSETNIAQLNETFFQYKSYSGYDIKEAIEREFYGDTVKAFHAIVERVKKQTRLFADTFYDALKVMKTEIQPGRLSRLVAAHSKIDMKEIKQAYSKKYPISLEEEISEKTTGKYKELLLAFVK